MVKKEETQNCAQTVLNKSKFWESDYTERILKILKEQGVDLKPGNLAAIVHATSFQQLSSDPRFKSHCPCYETSIQCHTEVKDLNCLLCNCPNYEVDLFTSEKNEDMFIGRCKANSKKGKYYSPPQFPEVKIWDCSNCLAYHHPRAVAKYLRIHISELQQQAQALEAK